MIKNISQVLMLGVPFDNLTLDSAVDRILNLAGHYRKLGQAKLVATVNVDFLTNALAWRAEQAPRHPELLHILRQADLVTADGMPLVWLSKLLNLPLKERVAGSDLVPALAKAAEVSGQSFFLLGGKGYVAQRAAERLKQQFPKLNIAGVLSPFVYSDGEKMLESEQDDEKIVEFINQSNVDILLIGFGNPKQELFFQRNRHRLKVGVAIGVGGTFEFITGRIARAPVWMQKTGLEWLFRISQDPKRLWKRYAVGLAKLATLVTPLVTYHKYCQWFSEKDHDLIVSNKISFELDEENCLKMPVFARGEIFPHHWIEEIGYRKLKSADSPDRFTHICFDFSQTQCIDAQALANLVRVVSYLHSQRINVSFVGLTNQHVVKTLKLSHVWDVFSQNNAPDMKQKTDPKQENMMESFAPKQNPNHALLTIQSQQEDLTIVTMKGRLDASWVNGEDVESAIQILGDRDGILDLSQLQFIDSTGLRVFFKIKQRFEQKHHRLILCSANETIMQLLQITRIDSLFQVSNDITQAKNFLAQDRDIQEKIE